MHSFTTATTHLRWGLCAALLFALAPLSIAQPLNDEPNTYFALSALANTPFGPTVVTANATDDPQYIPSCQSASGKGIWYAANTAPATAVVTFDTVGSDFDTILSVWEFDTSAGGLVEIACDDDGGADRLSQLDVTISGPVYIQLSGFSGASGFSALNVTTPIDLTPPDDFFQRPDEALPMLFGNTHQSFNTSASEFGNDPPSCMIDINGLGTNDIWRSFVPETNGFVTIDTFGSNFDTVLSVYQRFENNEIACNDDGGTGVDSRNARIENLQVNAGLEYHVRVAGFSNFDNGAIRINLSEVTAMPVSNEEATTPDALALDAAYPNPFATQTTLAYTLHTAQEARLVAYDLLGREVAVLVDGLQPAGTHEATLDATGLPSGTYVVRLATEAGTRTQRVVVVR